MTSVGNNSRLTISEARKKIMLALQRAGIKEWLSSPKPELTTNAQKVLERRYRAKDREGNVVEDQEQMFLMVTK